MKDSCRNAGFTVVEAVVSSVIVFFLVMAAFHMVSSSRRSHDKLGTTIDLSERVRHMVGRLSEEVRAATPLGEDVNQNSVMDTGEDTNGNGRFDADWNVGTGTITFNRRLPDGTVSLPIAYTLTGTSLERIETITAGPTTRTSVMDDSVTLFTVTENGSRIDIALTLERTSSDGMVQTRSQTITVFPRN